MTLPLGLALPAVAADAPDSSPVVTLPEGEAPTPAEQSFVPEASNNQGVVEQSPSEELPATPSSSDAESSQESGDVTPSQETQVDFPVAEVDMDLDVDLGFDPEGGVYREATTGVDATTTVKNHRFFLNDRWTGAANTEFTWGTLATRSSLVTGMVTARTPSHYAMAISLPFPMRIRHLELLISPSPLGAQPIPSW